MQNRKLQGDDIGKLKMDAKNTSLSSETQITGADSAMGQGSYSRRPLVPSVSDTVSTTLYSSSWKRQQQNLQNLSMAHFQEARWCSS